MDRRLEGVTRLRLTQTSQRNLSDKCWQGSIDPVEDCVIVPEVGAPHISLGREQRGEHRGLSTSDKELIEPATSQPSLDIEFGSSPVNSERPLVARHVCIHPARVDVIHHDVLPGVAIHLPLLDPRSRGRH